MKKVVFYNALLILIFAISACEKEESKPEDSNQENIRNIIGDFYVSTSGDDSNPGTAELPWKTIQKAANTVSAGKIVVIKKGEYNEYVTITQSGTDEQNRIIFFSETLYGAKCKGFKVKGNYINIDGFTVEADGITNWAGIYIDRCSYIDILNCLVQECPMNGIYTINTNYSRFTNNNLEHNGQSGIFLFGSNCLIEKNVINRTVQYHPKGNEPGFTGADADGLRIFGDGNIIRANSVTNIGDPDDSGNIDPHADCIQTWDENPGGRPVMTNTIIESNFFSVNHPYGKGIMIEATKGNACKNITIRNNIFEFRDIGISAYNGTYEDFFVYNNIFKATIGDATSWGTAVSFTNIQNYAFINNITVDCHPEHRHIIDGTGVIDYNLAWNSDGTNPTLTPALQLNEIIGNPLFVNYTGAYRSSNYHLSGNSPAIDKGFTISDITIDYDSITRPQGSSFDIGPFEYVTH